MIKLEKIEFARMAELSREAYFNTAVGVVNDHVVRVSVMTTAYPWHWHPNSDETFIGVEGIVIIETLEGEVELTPGSSVTVPRNMVHRTRPKGERSVNLTVERGDMETVFGEGG
jgi:mannose-6-phosphate isomerase-like protein (cupin superfamily)